MQGFAGGKTGSSLGVLIRAGMKIMEESEFYADF